MSELEGQFKELRREVTRQKVALERLALVIAHCARTLLHHDQAACLRNLKARIMKEVEEVRGLENSASIGSNQGKLAGSLVAFVLGSSFAAAAGQKSPVSAGARLFKSALARNRPFGAVLIAVGREGLPQDVKVVPLSRLARESNTPESEVSTTFQNRGYLLMKPETFVEVLCNLERKVLDGSMSLPVDIEPIASELKKL